MNRAPATTDPPPLPRARNVLGLGAGSWLIGALAVIAAARISQMLPIPWPKCGLRALTGIPCPLCGSTRSLAAWTRLDVAAAFAFNPLVATACIVGLAWLILRWLDTRCGGRWGRRARWSTWSPWTLWALAGLMVVNWVYLMFQLPP